jgi:glutamate carboxypeptidase
MTDQLDVRAVGDHVAEQRDEMVALLTELVDLESPSHDAGAQVAVRHRIDDQLRAAGMRTRVVRGHGVGDHLLARPSTRRRGMPVQLTLGHIDTVWPLGTAARRPAEVTDGRLSGPGSFDMKAGLVQLVFALRCLRDLDLEPPADVVAFVNTDEEIGSPDSRRWIVPLAKIASRAFVLEGAVGLDGALKVGRKGVGRFTLRAKGVAAHAGLDPSSGASAVLEISHQIQRLFALNDPERGITVNVGTVDGGLRPNVVAPEASAEIDVRVVSAADARSVEAAIRAMSSIDSNVTLSVEGTFGRPPMERNEANEAIWRQASAIADELGLDLDARSVGGASDGNLTSPHTATLDGLGAVGDGAHREDEHVIVRAIPERAALLASLLMAPIGGGS